MTDLPGRRLLLVHAHPDDESINNGATMAAYAAAGVHVALVTCTRGEEGEIIPPGLGHLAADRDDALGPHRETELAAAMRRLGVRDHRFLGGPGRYRDSGMAGAPQNSAPGAFWSAPLDEAAALLVPVVRELRPQVLVTYDPDGGYGHPDHVKAHRVATRAVELAGDPAHGEGAPHRVARVFWTRMPRSVALERFADLPGELGALPFAGSGGLENLPGVVDDERITTAVDGTPYAEAKAAAMAAHATQIEVVGRWFALSNGLAQPLFATEYYELAGGKDTEAPAADLFAGLPPEVPEVPGAPGVSGGQDAARGADTA
ncbi:N-acetyl-1-D-myo-inositol-2-amino-2-deoxy-alpha-D-glucopyranoside deacetylase [Streptomyces sp. NPDC050560]|uniref:N-acetyl-1-D-myo-inositol-2-amino-2-deoxy-alpha- D-glucopyranoside deacetylase n=1 Tax=Streptomyces sp. NPDC050560 TaxID=3365630 RepID=UPI00378F7919